MLPASRCTPCQVEGKPKKGENEKVTDWSMRIVATYSFNGGHEFIKKHHPNELREAFEIIRSIDANKFKTKRSKEKTMLGRYLYAPKRLNKAFHKAFSAKKWKAMRVLMKTRVPEIKKVHKGFREMDKVKNHLGVEIQFGKYSFMVYNVSAKMTIFKKKGIIDSGVEIVPMRSLAIEMSTGVSYFEQIKSDLEVRGISNIDIPVLVLGIAQ